MSDCEHIWSVTSISMQGIRFTPCLRPLCESALAKFPEGEQIVPSFFSCTIRGVTLNIEDDPQGGVSKIIMFELKHSYRLHELPLTAGDVVLDIGAHVGVVSIYLALSVPGLRIFAYEPHPDNFEHLLRNIGANHAEGITAVNLAVTEDGRDLVMGYNNATNTGGASAFIHAADTVNVHSINLADVMREHGLDHIRLLKLDCEGSEYEIIHSNPDLLRQVDFVRGEFHTNAYTLDQGYDSHLLETLCRAQVREDVRVGHVRMSD